MALEKKRCLFCDELVSIDSKGAHDQYIGCYCTPDHYYRLHSDSYDSINRLSYQQKRQIFPLVSGYIRELTDCDEEVTLSEADLGKVQNSPRIPVTIEEKGTKLLQHLFRHSKGPGEAVVIHNLSHSYNLTYSNSLQELVYIIEKLKEELLLTREGVSFKLTDQGWREAAASAGGRKLKPCCILLANDQALNAEWSENILPKIEQSGYMPSLFNQQTQDKTDHSLGLLADSKLVIADLSIQAPEVYYAGGYAAGLNIPVIWTIHRTMMETVTMHTQAIRPIVWDTSEELGAMLQQRLGVNGVEAAKPV